MRLAGLIAVMALAGCDALPRDPDGTLDRIRQTRVMRVGLMDVAAAQRPVADALLAAIAARTGARPQIGRAAGEPALAALDEGRLDLVIGAFDVASPWKSAVAFGPALARTGSDAHPIVLRAAMRNGENRWIMLVEDASRSVAPEAAGR